MRKQIFTLCQTTILILSMFVVTSAIAQDTLLINYQGRLTDVGDEPVTGTPSMVFTIYDGSGFAAVSKWSETHPTVQVTDGLFNVILGSVSALPDTVFSGEERYLGVAVDGDPEIVPRTLLTSSPGAAYTRKMVGDITTESGSLVMRSSEGVDSAIVLTADDLASKIKIGMSIPPDPVRPGLEMGADEFSNFLKINWLFSAGPYKPAFEVSSDVTEGIKMKLGIPPDDIKPSFEVSSDAAGEKIKMKLGTPPDDQKPVFEVEADATTERVKMVLGIPPDPYAPAFEFSTSTTDGAGMNIFDEIGQVMGLEPTPFNEGYNMTLYDPTQVAETPLISFGTDYSNSSEARFQMFSSQAADPTTPEIEMVSSENFNRFTFGLSYPPDPYKPGLEMTSNTTTATMLMGGGPPMGMLDQQFITLTTDLTSAKIGIGTDTPAEALDVRGTAEVEGFKMATGASDGRVLTSDANGNGTWQAAASGRVEAGEFDGELNSDMVETVPGGATTIYFDNPFTTTEKPHMIITVVLKQAANGLVEGAAIKAVVDIKGSSGNWTGFDITVSKYSDGSSISDTVDVYVTWTAIEQ